MRPPLTDVPCWRCLALAGSGRMRAEAVQRVPDGAWAPRQREQPGSRICFDCASADGLAARFGMTFTMARIAVANERQEQYRLPGAPMGLVAAGYVRASQPGDFDDQLTWLDRNGWFQLGEGEEAT